MADIACQDAYKLYEEAVEILKKFNLNEQAVEVLLVHLESLERGVEFATRCDDTKVWSRLGRAQLDANYIKEAVESFIRADDADSYLQVSIFF